MILLDPFKVEIGLEILEAFFKFFFKIPADVGAFYSYTVIKTNTVVWLVYGQRLHGR